MAEQRLDEADIDPVLKQVGGKAVPQRVRADMLVEARGVARLDNDAVQLAGAERLEVVLTRNSQPSGCSTPCCRPAFHHSRRSAIKPVGSRAVRYCPPFLGRHYSPAGIAAPA